MLKKLRLKMVCIMMGFVTLMLIIIFGLIIVFMGNGLRLQNEQTLQSISDTPMMIEPFGPGKRGARVPYLVVQLHRDEIFAVRSGGYELPDEDAIRDLIQAAAEADGQKGILDDYELQFHKSTRKGIETIVFLDISSQKATMTDLIQSCILIGAVSFCIFLILSILLARWAVRPVEQAWQQQKQFVADASHELKTPLAVILTNAELLRERESSSEQIEHILTMARQMRFLVEGLLELARMDGRGIGADFATLDLSTVTEETLLPFEPLFFEQGLELISEIESGITVRGNERYLHQVEEILLDNAMKYSMPGGRVVLGLKKQAGACVLWVANPGESISRDDLKNIFKRFYRVDKARHRDGSYGLGLSIAEGIVQAHGGKIWAESANGINTFFVQLPMKQ